MATLDDFLSFLQGASNSAASVVSAPVDGINWALGKVGVPVSNKPVGGSEWLREAGFTVEPKNQTAGLLGEAVGGVLPIVAQAKAPQIAAGINKMVANAQAPRMLDPQTGAIVWHGSPHQFAKFDSSKIGTGEGAQAYGHGLYFAESPEVAQQYQKQLGTTMTVDGKPLLSGGRVQGTTGNKELDGLLELYGGDMKQAIRDQLGIIRDSRYRLSLPEAQSETVQRLNKAALKSHQRMLADMKGVRDKAVVRQDGSLYKVDLPDEAIAKMLDWDKPFAEMGKDSQTLVRKLGFGRSDTTKGSEIYNRLAEIDGQAAAAKALRDAGIPGIRYLDGGSRGVGQGTSNFVVFPGNEGLLTILERNGQRLP